MAKGKGQQPAAAAAADEDTLADDVKAFASKLGFASVGADFGYDDFAPQAAKKPLAAAAKQQKQPPAAVGKKRGREEASQAGVKPHKHPAGKPRHPAAAEEDDDEDDDEDAADEDQQPAAAPDPIKDRKWVESVGPRPGAGSGKSLLGRDEPTIWYEAAAGLAPLKDAGAAGSPLDDAAAEMMRQRAEALLEHEAAVFEKDLARRNSGDTRWLAQVRRSGTTSDKVAAMTLLVQESVLGNLRSLDGLLALMAKRSGGRDVVGKSLEALQELWVTVLLPDRKLKVLEAQPLHLLPSGKEGDRRLLLWGLEDALKARYKQYVQLLEETSRDSLEFLKERATKALFQALSTKPEAEAQLLAGLVNKLGDPSRKVASKAGYLLSQLLQQHPGMKVVVVREVETFLFRPNLADRAQYYAITFLNQLELSHKPRDGGSALAKSLIGIYFRLFALILAGKMGAGAAAGGEGQDKGDDKQQQHKQQQQQSKGGKGGKGRGSSKQQRRRGHHHHHHHHPPKQQQRSSSGAGAEQAEVEMDARMLSALITGVRRAFPYVAAEEVEPLVEEHSEALFRLVHKAPFSVALQALLLMHQLLAGRQAVSDRFYRALYSVLLTPGPRASSGRAPQFMSLLFKALKADVSTKRVAAFVKRLLQVAAHAPAAWAAGALLLVSEVLRVHPGLWASIQQPEDVAGDQEGFKDAPDSEDGEEEPQQQQQQQQPQPQQNGVQPSGGAASSGLEKWPKEGYYDMDKREPSYAAAETSCVWELLVLGSHLHPSVSAFARALLSGTHVAYDGDPLREFTLPVFLDKFVAKKPKAAGAKGSSLMQPLLSAAAAADKADRGLAALGSDAFAALAQAQVEPSELFFHKFYSLKGSKPKAKKAKAKKEGDGSSSDEGDGGDSDDLGELGVDDVASDGDLDDDEVDRLLDRQAGVGDEELGDPDVGDHDYDQLLAAMEGADSDQGGASDEGEDPLSDEGGSEDDEGGSADDGELEGSEGEGEEEMWSEDAGEGGSSDSIDTASSEGDEDDSLYVMLTPDAQQQQQQPKPGKAQAKGKQKVQQQESEEDPDDLDLMDLPSPSSSSEDGGGGSPAGASSSSDGEGPGRTRRQPAGGRRPTAGKAAGAGGGSRRAAKAAAAGLSGIPPPRKRRQKGEDMFAAADGFEDYFKQYENALQQQDKEGQQREGKPAGTGPGSSKKQRRQKA